MNTQDFTTTLLVDVTPHQVFNAVNNVRGWWSENIDGDTDRPGSKFEYHYQDVHICKIQVTEFVDDKKVAWHMQNNYFKFTKNEHELTGSDVVFDISVHDGKTQLIFTHKGLMPLCECYQICSDAWTYYIQESLKNLILTGRGNATPKDADEIGSEHAVNSLAEQHTSLGIHHQLLIEKPAEIVYGALATQKGLAGWWTPDTIAKPEVGSVSRFAFGPDYHKDICIEDLQPYSLVKWRCLKGFEDWVNTTISFELQPHAKGTVLVFHHEGWRGYSNEFASCSYDWALFLRSLKFLCETGRGFPYPGFNK